MATEQSGRAEQREQTYDVVVIGAGAVGENAADRASRTGLSVVVVESELVGGECSYWACMPSKALLRPGAVLAEARGVPGAGSAVTGHVDAAATLARRDEMASGWDDAGQEAWLTGAGLDLVRGTARLVGERHVVVTGDDGEVSLRARHAVVVATGSEPVIPDVPGLAGADPWTSREATSLRAVPSSVAVLGGGVVAVEMATALRDLGAAVTVLVRGPRVLSAAEPLASDAVASGLRALGVDLRLGSWPRSVRRGPDGVHLTTDDGEVVAQEVLVATGRRPRTDELGLESVGLEPGVPLAVDPSGRVLAADGDWLWAVGDVTGRTATTHQGKYDARVTGDAIAHRFGTTTAPDGGGEPPAWSPERADADGLGAPQVVFTRPEVASVGRTEAAARHAGLRVRAVDVPLSSTAGAAFLGDSSGSARIVVDEDRGVIVGATFVGSAVAEMLHAATIAVVGEVPLTRLWHAVPAYPTVSEVWLRLLEAYGL